MYLFIDTETGGLDRHCSLLSLGLVLTDEKFNEIDRKHWKLAPNDGKYVIEPKALEVNKIDLSKHHAEACSYFFGGQDLSRFLQKHHNSDTKLIPIGKNVAFDLDFIHTYLLDKTQWELYVSHRALDLSSVAQFMKMFGILPKNVSVGLESLCKHFNIPLNNYHEALGDCLLTKECLLKLSEYV